jgi:hypothetical protein
MTDIEKTIEEAKAELLPFESWEKLPGESGAAYAAFCVYRDFGPERNIRKVAEKSEADTTKAGKRYRVWRLWSMRFKWVKRAEDYDLYLDRLKQTETRKTIEARGEAHREVTGKMLQVVNKKLDMMNPDDLSQGTVTEWVETAIRMEREIGQFELANCLGVSTCRNSMPKQGEISFTPDFEGL